MSYHVRNPYQKSLRQQPQQQRELLESRQDEDESPVDWNFVSNNSQKRVSNSKDEEEYDENGNLKVTQYDSAAMMASPDQPVVTYSSRKPNYPTAYSCEHNFLYGRNSRDEGATEAPTKSSFSNDNADNELATLNESPTQLSLEFEMSTVGPADYDEIISNVEALQWSLLNEISARSGLSKGCKIENQYDERTVVTALTTMNDMHSTVKDEKDEELSNTMYRNKRYSNSGKSNRHRTRKLERDRTMLSSLPYPTSIYSIASNRPKWTASCSSKMIDEKETTNQCFTTQITFDVKYSGSTGESNLIEQYVQSIIHNQIAIDAKQLFAEDITELKWISNDEAASVFDGSNLTQGTPTPIFFGPDNSIPEQSDAPFVDVIGVDAVESQTEETSNDYYASILIPIGTFIMLCAIWYCTHMHYVKKRETRQKQRQLKQEQREEERSGELVGTQKKEDIETGSVSTGKTRESIGLSRESISSSDTQESEGVRYCGEVIAKSLGLLPAASSSRTPTKSTPSKRNRKSVPISVDSPERSAAGLPPRPMMVKRAVSKQLKKKRRKKKSKKKKVLALTRVNSKDNFTEMPMISESESECDSEYTSGDEEYSEDGSSYDASAGCLTPGGSFAPRSRTSSTANSPQKSLPDDLFSSGTMDPPGYEFVNEVPEFSKDFFSPVKKEFVIETPKFSKDLFAEFDQKQIIGVDENQPPSVTLRPRTRAEPNVLKPRSEKPKKRELPAGKPTERRPMEIDARSELDRSFSEENGSVMHRMLPLPWLATSKSNRMS